MNARPVTKTGLGYCTWTRRSHSLCDGLAIDDARHAAELIEEVSPLLKWRVGRAPDAPSGERRWQSERHEVQARKKSRRQIEPTCVIEGNNRRGGRREGCEGR